MLLVYLLLPIFCSGIKCNKCIESILDPNPTCTSCDATTCYILEYTYKYSQYSGHKAYEKGCFTSPSDIPTECRKNMHNNTLCTCNEDYCNTPELLPKVGVTPIPIVQCTIDGLWSPDNSKCLGHMCGTRREGVGNSSCSGQYCMSAFVDGMEDVTCMQQTDVQGIQLKPGYYNFGSTHFYICDTEMCNEKTDAYGKPRTEVMTTKSPALARPEDCCPRGKKGQSKAIYTVTLLYVICNIV